MTLFPDIYIRFHFDYIKGTRSGSNIKRSKTIRYELIQDCLLQELNITIPLGFLTDLSSIPRILWSFIPPFGMVVPASILHDYLYQTGYYENRKDADKLFYNTMIAHNVPKWQAKLMYWAVRLFGKSRYNIKKEA